MTNVRNCLGLLCLGLAISGNLALAGVLDPDCTGAKATAMRATVGIEDKGPLEKRRGKDGPLDNVRDKG